MFALIVFDPYRNAKKSLNYPALIVKEKLKTFRIGQILKNLRIIPRAAADVFAVI